MYRTVVCITVVRFVAGVPYYSEQVARFSNQQLLVIRIARFVLHRISIYLPLSTSQVLGPEGMLFN